MATGTAVDVVMPQMGVSVSEGTITRWLKNVGDTVEADEPLLEISTDKVDTEVPSPGTGVVSEILVQEGETVDVGTVLARIGGDGARAPAAAAEPEPSPRRCPSRRPRRPPTRRWRPPTAACARRPRRSSRSRRRPSPRTPHAGNGHGGDEHHFVSPVVARIAAEHGIDPAQVDGTGRGGRVTKKDILAFVESRRSQRLASAGRSPPRRTARGSAASAAAPPHRRSLRRRPRPLAGQPPASSAPASRSSR